MLDGINSEGLTVTLAMDAELLDEFKMEPTQLTKLNVSGTAVTEQGVNAAKKFLPFWATVTR